MYRCSPPAFEVATGSKPFDATKLSMVRLKFDRTPMSVICISELGFETK